MGVFSLVHAGRRDTEREEAGIEAGKLRFDFGVVEKVGVEKFVEFIVLLTGWGTDDGENLLYVRVEEALAQNPLADHAGCSEEDYVHLFML